MPDMAMMGSGQFLWERKATTCSSTVLAAWLSASVLLIPEGLTGSMSKKSQRRLVTWASEEVFSAFAAMRLAARAMRAGSTGFKVMYKLDLPSQGAAAEARAVGLSK